jgi:hypothetical protein
LVTKATARPSPDSQQDPTAFVEHPADPPT